MPKLLAVALLVTFSLSARAQGDPPKAFDPATAATRRPGTKLRIDLIGDSTQTEHAGYGRGFCANLTPDVECLNRAKGGASTKTFREQGLWDQALATKPDYMVIQFGHNDLEAVDGTPANDRQVSLAVYEANLRRFITEARSARITPVLVTPLTRQYFEADGKIHSDLLAHAAAMKRVAQDMHVPLIDLHAESIALLDKVGGAQASKLSITKKDESGKTIPDKTHLNWAGSYVFGRIVAKDLGEEVPALHPFVLPQAAKLPPAGLKAMKILEGGAVKIVLVGDSTVAPEGGWGPGFCKVLTPNVTCVDLALNGRSTKSFVDEGAWKKALDEHGDYYLIQFGHNDQKSDAARHTDANGSFQDYLRLYISGIRSVGGIPVLVTSLSRRTMKDGRIVEDLKDYAEAARKVGAEKGITVIDLNRISTDLLNHMSQAEADQFNATGHADQRAEAGKSTIDRTHLNPHGQAVFGRIVADTLVHTETDLGPDLIGEPAPVAVRIGGGL